MIYLNPGIQFSLLFLFLVQFVGWTGREGERARFMLQMFHLVWSSGLYCRWWREFSLSQAIEFHHGLLEKVPLWQYAENPIPLVDWMEETAWCSICIYVTQSLIAKAWTIPIQTPQVGELPTAKHFSGGKHTPLLFMLCTQQLIGPSVMNQQTAKICQEHSLAKSEAQRIRYIHSLFLRRLE